MIKKMLIPKGKLQLAYYVDLFSAPYFCIPIDF